MSAPMTLTGDQLAHLAEFLRAISKATREHQVDLGPYGRAELKVGDTVINFRWQEDNGYGQYVLDDRVGD